MYKMEENEWNILDECKLFEAVSACKPVGVNKNFQMFLLCEKLQEFLGREISSKKVWAHLNTMYNLEALDELEPLPFPNDEREFYLPDSEFGALKLRKEEKLDEKNNKVGLLKKPDGKDSLKATLKDVKKEDKTQLKKEMPRRDSKDGKELKTSIGVKKEAKKEADKSKQMKGGKLTSITKDDDKIKTPKMDEAKRVNKRPTRGSLRPEDTNSRKSQSPLTVTSSANKRRRL